MAEQASAEMKTSSRSMPIPDPTLLLFLMAGTLVAAGLATDPTTRLVLVCVALLPIGLWLFARLASNPQVGVALLLVASAVPRGAVEIAGMNVRPEHLAVGLVCLALPFLLRRFPGQAEWILADYLLAAYAGINILSSLLMSPDASQTFKWSLQQLLAILPYFILRLISGDNRRFRWAFRAFLVVGTLAAAYGVAAYYSNFLFGTEFGVEVEQYGSIPATYGTQFEANILGAYCGAFAVAMLAMYLQKERRIYLVGYGITLAGMGVSLSRGALGATLIGFLVLGYLARRGGLLNRRVLTATLVATFWVGVACLPVLAPRYSERLSTINVSDPTADEDTMFRVVQFAGALDDIADSPLLGHGTSSFQLLFAPGAAESIIGTNVPWIANSELRIVHDTGAIGLGLFLLFLGVLLRKAWPMLRHGTEPALLALLTSAVVYCVSFQATEGTILAFFWVHVGLIGCLVAIELKNPRKGVGVPGK